MNFPDATQVIKAIKIPNVAILVGKTILAPLRNASAATTEAATAMREKILEPVCDDTTNSLIRTHSLFSTKPNVVSSFPGFKKPKNKSERTDSEVVTETPANLRFSMFDRTLETFKTWLIRSTP
jgi:hypothetical protein